MEKNKKKKKTIDRKWIICVICENEIPDSKRVWNTKTCSRNCSLELSKKSIRNSRIKSYRQKKGLNLVPISNCPICNKELPKNNDLRIKLCLSERCREEYSRLYRKERYLRNREEFIRDSRERYQKKKAELGFQVKELKCVICSQNFIKNSRGIQKTCSSICSKELKKESLRRTISKRNLKIRLLKVFKISGSVIKKPIFFNCKVCNKKFQVNKKGEHKLLKTCSLECSKINQVKNRKKNSKKQGLLASLRRTTGQKIQIIDNCKVCKKSFPKRWRSKFCSSRCQIVDKKILKTRFREKEGIKYGKCIFCYEEFKRKHGTVAVVCSKPECKKKRMDQRRTIYRMTHIKCAFCRKWIKKKTNVIYCSVDCKEKYRKNYLEKNIICIVCQKKLIVEPYKKVCSIECQKEQTKYRRLKAKGKKVFYCDICRKSFVRKSHSTTCSSECQKIRKQIQRRERHIEQFQQGTNKSIVRTYRVKIRGLKVFFDCIVCDKEFERKGSSSTTTCSPRCWKIRDKERHREDARKYRLKNSLKKVIKCENCSKEFVKGKKKKFCSLECSKKKKLTKSKCKTCKKVFEPHQKRVKYCSVECRKENNKISTPRKIPKTKKRKCSICKKNFLKKRFVYCSLECKKIKQKRVRLAKKKPKTQKSKVKLPVPCPNCETPFFKSAKCRNYCSVSCRRDAANKRKREERAKTPKPPRLFDCVICGKEFQRFDHKSNVTCSLSCSRKRRQWRYKNYISRKLQKDPSFAEKLRKWQGKDYETYRKKYLAKREEELSKRSPNLNVECMECSAPIEVKFYPNWKGGIYQTHNDWFYYTEKEENKGKYKCKTCLSKFYSNNSIEEKRIIITNEKKRDSLGSLVRHWEKGKTEKRYKKNKVKIDKTKRLCIICQELVPLEKMSLAKVCSDKCAKISERNYRLKKLVRKFPNCLQCGKDISSSGGWRVCSIECRKEFDRKRSREYARKTRDEKRKNRPIINCSNCDKEISKNYNSLKKICSEECVKELARKRWIKKRKPRTIINCIVCDNKLPNRYYKKFCSSNCSNKWFADKQRQQRGTPKFFKCFVCKNKFVRKKREKICSDACFTNLKEKKEQERLEIIKERETKRELNKIEVEKIKQRILSPTEGLRIKEWKKPPKECSICGKIYNLKTCSDACKLQRRKENWLKYKALRIGYKYVDCFICKKRFKRIGGAKCCSPKCKRERKLLRAKIHNTERSESKPKINVECLSCKETFINLGNRRYCSFLCSRKGQKQLVERYKVRKEESIRNMTFSEKTLNKIH